MTAGQPLFLFGTLCDGELYEIVAGEPFAPREAMLPDHAARWVAGETYPILSPSPGSCARGWVVTPSEVARARLDFYLTAFGHSVEPHTVLIDGAPTSAAHYIPHDTGQTFGAAWSLTDWQRDHGPLTREAAREYMRLIETHTPEAAAGAFPMVLSRAASRLRARAAPSPAAFQAPDSLAEVRNTGQPYTDYFAVREDWLRVPTFGGGHSETVKRATFMGGDAVTVLPYDGATGKALIIRQFRHGPFVRGDANPWCVEPPAGRIDPGETAEAAAHRELREETGLTATALHKIAAYYPTPGAYSEHLTSYVALCDLTGRDGQVMGEASEHEDIMSHVVSLDDLAAMIESGAVNTGPLVLSIHWLLLNRNTLS